MVRYNLAVEYFQLHSRQILPLLFLLYPSSMPSYDVSRFAPTSGTWMFDAPHALDSRQALSPESLQKSLEITLNAYPQWAGQLQFTQFDEEAGKTDHTRRGFGRLEIKHGSLDEDPGVELVISHCDVTLASIVPTSSERNMDEGVWDPTLLDSIGLLPDAPALALEDMEISKGLPSVIIQLTSFRGSG